MAEVKEVAEKLVRPSVPALDEILGVVFPVLDKGFVRVVDYMGDDGSVVQAARVSYGAGTKKVSEDDGLIRYLMRHSHCYDASTDVLTADGFKPWPAVTEGDVLGIWDEERQTLCYEKPEYLTKDYYDGDLYSVEHGGVSLLVTPEHKMWVKTKESREHPNTGKQMLWCDRFSLIPADELGNRSMVKYSKIAPFKCADDWNAFGFPPCDDPRELLRLIGFFIGDGTVSRTSANGVQFHLFKERKKVYLREVVAGVGWELRESQNATAFSVNAPGVGHLFRENFYTANGDKYIPDFLRMLNQEDALALLDGFKNSDGTKKRSTWEYSTSVPDVAEQIQRIALHAGEAAHVYISGDMRRVMILARMREPVINQSRINTKTVRYKGDVYCAKTRTGILVVRRNGKVVLSGNTTPTEMAEIKLHVKVPMDCWRQWIRHRTASVNEYSTRYSEAIDDNQETPPEQWRLQSAVNKQGSGGTVTEWPESLPAHPSDFTPGQFLSERENVFHASARDLYQERLEFGVAREQARKDLPLSTYTEAYWKIDLHNLLHFLSLRIDAHAQLEIRSYANVIGDIVAKWVPLTWAAFNDYNFRRNALLLSARDKAVLRAMHNETGIRPEVEAMQFGWLEKREDGTLRDNRERSEFESKIAQLGLIAPWRL